MLASLKRRFLLGAVVFILAALAVAAAGLSFLFERHVKTWIDAELDGGISQIIAGIEPGPGGSLSVQNPLTDPRYETPFSGRYWQVVFPATGNTIRSRSLWDHTITVPSTPAIGSHTHHHRLPGPNGQTLYVVEKLVELPARLGRQTVRVAVGLDEADVTAAVWQFTTALAPLLFLLAALLSAAAWVQVTLGLRPLTRIKDRISAIRSGASRRLGGEFPEEVHPLAEEIDKLLDARDAQVETARARASDLAHGLKTPIQVLIGGIAKLKAQGATSIAGDLENAATLIERHVERQLARTRVSAGDRSVTSSIADVTARIVRVVRKTPDGARLSWADDVPASLQARIHPDDLAEALGGLIENAARHAATRVAVTASKDADGIAISVSDDGPGIPEDQFEAVLGRGIRLDTSGPGSGLGLAIASDIADAWGGQISFARNGGQFSVTLRLPDAAPRH